VGTAPLDAREPQQQRATLEYGMVVEVQDRAGQLALIPAILRRVGNQAAAQFLPRRRSGDIR